MKQLTVCVIATSVSINNYSSFAGLIGHTGMISSTPVRTLLDLSGPFWTCQDPLRTIITLIDQSGTLWPHQDPFWRFSTFLDQSGPLRKCQDLCFTLLCYQYPFQVRQGHSGSFRTLLVPSGYFGTLLDPAGTVKTFQKNLHFEFVTHVSWTLELCLEGVFPV